MATKDEIIESLKTVVDPEINLDIWTLGLVYNIDIQETKVKILMTLTSPMCPFGPFIIENVKERVGSLQGVKEINIEVTFTPPWQPSDDLRAMLGV